MLAVIVCGGRAYAKRDRVFEVLDEQQPSFVIEGAGWPEKTPPEKRTGAGWWAHCWRVERGIRGDSYPANWRQLGDRAGPTRNQQMLFALRGLGKGYAIRVIAFPGGDGTANMVGRARAAGVTVVEVDAAPTAQGRLF